MTSSRITAAVITSGMLFLAVQAGLGAPKAKIADLSDLKPVPAVAVKLDTKETVDVAKDFVTEKPVTVQVDLPNAPAWRLDGSLLLGAPGARFVLELAASDPAKRPVLAFGLTRGKGDAIQFTDAAKGTPDMPLGEKAGVTWLPFSLTGINGMAELKVNDRAANAMIPADAGMAVRLSLSPKAGLRGVTTAVLPVSDNLLVPVFLDQAASLPLAGPGAELGSGLALAPDALAEGLKVIDGIPFFLSGKGVDVSASTAGLSEPLRSKWAMWGVVMGPKGRVGAQIPADQYGSLHLLAFSRTLKGAVPRMTVRVGWSIMENTRVDVPELLGKAKGDQLVSALPVQLVDGRKGTLYHLCVPLAATGNFWEMRSREKLDLEFARDVNVHVNHPDPNEFGEMPAGLPSSVVVVAAALERSPVEVSYNIDEPVPIFHDTQKVAWKVRVSDRTGRGVRGRVAARCAGPGTVEEARADRLEWAATAAYSLDPNESKEVVLDLTPPSGKRGWYSCAIEAWAGKELAQARETSFAFIAPDTRQAREDSPFGTWVWTGPTHAVFAPRDQEERLGTICRKGGWRWSVIQGSEKHLLKATCQSPPQGYQRIPGWFDPAGFEKEVVPWLKEAPTKGLDNYYKVMHESRSSGRLLLRFSELLGGQPYDMPADEKQRLDGQFEKVAQYCQAIKKADPHAKIVLINDYPAVGVEFMKRGFPKDAVDVFGTEGAMFMREPERQPDWLCLLGVLQQWRRAMEKYGYQDKQLWTTEALYHSTNPGNLTLHKQAVIYAREAMLALANGVQRMVGQGTPRDYTSDYRWSNWGCTGFCFRDPEYNPKPSFAMFAWLTQALDQAKFAGFLKHDSTSLHVLDFAKPDQRHVYPVWVVRGRQKVALRVEGGSPAAWDNYGNAVAAPLKAGVLTLEVGDAPLYVTGTTVKEVVSREPVELKAEPGQVLTEFDGAKPLKTVDERSAVLEANWDFPRLKGAFRTDAAVEDGVTALRVELLADDDPRKLLQRYVELALAEPVALEGRPHALTVRLKGNGAWGKVMFELVDAKGRVWTSCGNRHSGAANSSDCKGDSFVSFDGWQTMRIPLPGQYPGEDQFVAWPSLCDWWSTNAPEWPKVLADYEAAKAEYAQRMAEYEPLLKAHKEALAAYEEAKKQGKATGQAPQAPKEPATPREPENTGLARVDYPLRLTKLIFAMSPHFLYVNTEVPVAKPVIFLDKLGVLQAPEGI